MSYSICYLKVSFFYILFIVPTLIFSNITLTIKEKAGVNRVNEMVHNGIPVSRLSNLVDISDLLIIDNSGNSVDAQFEVLSRWGGGKLGNNPIQWLLITFPASVSANRSATYILKSGSHTITGPKLKLTEDQNIIIVNTGIAKFKISKKVFNVFEEASFLKPTEQKLIGGSMGEASIHVDNKPVMKASAPSEITIEHRGDLFITVKVAGYYTNPAYANIRWQYIARYSFFAGSPTAVIDFYYGFPGHKNGESKYEVYNWSELIKVKNVKLVFPINLSGTISGSVSGGKNEFLSESLPDNKNVSLKQHLRQMMTAPPEYTMSCGPSSHKGRFAEMPMVAISGSNGGVGMTIQKMKFYEPQSIVANKNQFEVNIVADSQWIAPFMGAYAKMAVTLQPSPSSWKSVAENITSGLDHKLFAWPSQKYVARTGIFDELWDGTDNPYAKNYWNKISIISKNTLHGYTRYGMHGFMTYGLVPRYWHDPVYSNEFGNTKSWDGYFKGGTFSDYHNVFSNVVRQFAQNSDSELLHNLAFPAARRSLNTLIIQDNPSSSYHYAGWAPIGYGGYRKDNNASHSYFENLYFYYYLTGDRRVLDVLYPAGTRLRLKYSRKSDGSLVPSDDPPIADWMGTVDRVASQMAAIYWFLGHASEDSSFFEDYINQYERLIDRHSAVLTNSINNKEYAFVSGNISNDKKSATTEQTWMTALYDMQNMWWIYFEFGDLLLGKAKMKISRFFKALNNTYWDYVSDVSGKRGRGSSQGNWANQMNYSWTGDKIGGTLTGVTLKQSSEKYLYSTGKANLVSFMFRSAFINQDTAQYTQAMEMAKYIINGNSYQNCAWDKASSLRWLRVHGAIHYMVHGIEDIAGIAKSSKPHKDLSSGNSDIKIITKTWLTAKNSTLSVAFSKAGKELGYQIPFHIAAYDSNGRMIDDSIGKTWSNKIIWNTSNLSRGFYVIEVDIGKKVYKDKILIVE